MVRYYHLCLQLEDIVLGARVLQVSNSHPILQVHACQISTHMPPVPKKGQVQYSYANQHPDCKNRSSLCNLAPFL